MNFILHIGLPVIAYLAGSIPFGLILTRCFSPVDIRSAGSGNIGATNVGRTAGKTLGIITLCLDMLKGFLPVALAASISNLDGMALEIFLSINALFCVLGHLCPVTTAFKGGGKGVATAAGCVAVISPIGLFVAVLVFILLVCITSRVSVGSLAAAAILPLAVWKSSASPVFTVLTAMVFFLIVIRHKDNIIRILNGTEPAI